MERPIATREEILGWLSDAGRAGHVGAMRLLLEELRRDAGTNQLRTSLTSSPGSGRRPPAVSAEKQAPARAVRNSSVLVNARPRRDPPPRE
jgi:hypothetical protein